LPEVHFLDRFWISRGQHFNGFRLPGDHFRKDSFDQ
jgi:hypothetical protein